MKIHVSKGNMKLGNIPNISLPPIVTCGKGRPCYEDCYAMKSYKQYPNVREAWDENLACWNSDTNWDSEDTFVAQMMVWLTTKKPEYFRWHVGGDIPDVEYYATMCFLAGCHRGTKFLAFTKNEGVLAMTAPSNLQVIFSRWPGDKEPGYSPTRQAWMIDEHEPDTRIPARVFECPGSCATCKYCFLDTGGDVAFHKH